MRPSTDISSTTNLKKGAQTFNDETQNLLSTQRC